MYLREFACEECGKVGIRRTASKKRCDKCQSAHRRERFALAQSRWRRKVGFGEVDMNHDENMEDAIYCG
jgi:hypothetical protein